MWDIDHRPTTLDDVVGQPEAVAAVRAYLRDPAAMPHVILHSQRSGTGKTTAALAMARAILGDGYRDQLLELNASNERGIDALRRVTDTMRYMAVDARLRLVLLEEADAITPEAQAALARPLERCGGHCKVIMTCNDVTKLVEKVRSRCDVLEFHPVAAEAMLPRLKAILGAEGIDVDADDVLEIASASDGDMRMAVKLLERRARVGFAQDAETEALLQKYLTPLGVK